MARMAMQPKEAPAVKKPSASPEDAALEEAFAAAKGDDKEAFVAAMRTAVRACIDAYDTEDEDDAAEEADDEE